MKVQETQASVCSISLTEPQSFYLLHPDVHECNERSHNCDVNAVCINTNSSYLCQCHNGFTGTGMSGSCQGLLLFSFAWFNHKHTTDHVILVFIYFTLILVESFVTIWAVPLVVVLLLLYFQLGFKPQRHFFFSGISVLFNLDANKCQPSQT